MKKLIVSSLLAAALIAQAAEFNALQPAKSGISFVSKQMGVPVEGKFGRFSAQIAFDPDKPAGGRARIDIEMASIDAGSAEANEEVKGKDWFNIKAFPSASFESSALRAAGAGRFEAVGKLTIKNVSRNVTVPFSFKPAGDTAVVEGSIPISRKQFGIGTGEWADEETVADEVQLRFKFVVAAKK